MLSNFTKVHKLSDDDAKALGKVRAIINVFREADHKIPASYIAAFLAVALEPGKGPTHYAQQLGTVQPIMSRLLLEIGQKSRHRDEPLGLVDREVSAHSLRDQEYFLTHKGKAMMNDLLEIIKH